jgi:uncharacterized membrane protein
MKEWLAAATEASVVAIDAMALAIVVWGTLEAFVRVVRGLFAPPPGPERRETWLRYARWLVAALTFQLAADIVETSITTSWEAIARVGAIAVIRTGLNYFLERDLAEIGERREEPA